MQARTTARCVVYTCRSWIVFGVKLAQFGDGRTRLKGLVEGREGNRDTGTRPARATASRPSPCDLRLRSGGSRRLMYFANLCFASTCYLEEMLGVLDRLLLRVRLDDSETAD